MFSEWSLPVLIFHHVSPDVDYYTNTRPQVFERQVETLARHYKFWTVREAYQAFVAGRSPNRHAVITFDDGYQDNFLFARPILDEHGIKATFFVLPVSAGRLNDWNPKCDYRVPHMTDDEMRELIKGQHEIGSHGLSHRSLVEMPLSEAEHEIVSSKVILEERLKVGINSFSFPYGVANDEVSRIAAKYYAVAFSTVKSNQTNWCEGRHYLRRTYIPVNADPHQIALIMSGEAKL